LGFGLFFYREIEPKMKTPRILLALCLVACSLNPFEISAQEAPITLITETSTTYYTDGTSRSRATMMFEVQGVKGQQPLGFLGRRLKEHLNPNPAVQREFKAFRTLSITGTTLSIACTATLMAAVFSDREVPADVAANGTVAEIWWGYKWPIITGVGYLAAGITAGKKLNRTIELHNGTVADGGKGFGCVPAAGGFLDAGLLQANSNSPGGLGLRLRF
jgi:hypothetical protein